MKRTTYGPWGVSVVAMGLALATAGAGCVSASFVRTADDFVQSARARRPEIFLDRKPQRPYRSVGLILVSGHRLEDVLDEVAEKGKEVGCDVVVDRRIHVTLRVDPGDRVDWAIVLDGEDGGLRTGVAVEAPKSFGERSTRTNAFGYPPLSHPTPVVIYRPAAPPAPEREFICGIYTEDSLVLQAPLERRGSDKSPVVALWSFVTADREGRKACLAAREMLGRDESCEREQCAVPLLLARHYANRCRDIDPESTAVVGKLESQWKSQTSGTLPGPCLTHLVKALHTPKAAERFRKQCLQARPASYLETAILEHAVEGLNESEK